MNQENEKVKAVEKKKRKREKGIDADTGKEVNEKIKPIGKTKKKRVNGNNVRTGEVVQVVKDENVTAERKKIKEKSIKKEIKHAEKKSSLVGKSDGGSLGEQHEVTKREEVNGKSKSIGKTKKKRDKGNNVPIGEVAQVVKDENVTAEGKKIEKKSIEKKIKRVHKNILLVGNSDRGSLGEQNVTRQKEENEKIKSIGKKKKKRDKGNNVGIQVIKDENVTAEGKKIEKKSIKKKIKHVHKNSSVVGKSDGDSLGEQNDDGSKDASASENQANVDDLKGKVEAIDGKSKNSKKRKKEDMSHDSKVLNKKDVEDDAHCISSGEDDCSKGMKKWLTEYHRSRPGLKVLQQRKDDFINAHDEKLEQEKKDREAEASKDGWTVVVHHKGRKKTTDSESGVTVGSVAPAIAEKLGTAKKHKEVNLEFYRFQKRESQRNEILALQNKFEQDKKRIQQLRAARKFKPY